MGFQDGRRPTPAIVGVGRWLIPLNPVQLDGQVLSDLRMAHVVGAVRIHFLASRAERYVIQFLLAYQKLKRSQRVQNHRLE